MTTARAFPPICARKCSNHSCGSMTRAIRTRAAPDLALPSRATSRARTVVTLRCRMHPLAVCGRWCGCRCRSLDTPLCGDRLLVGFAAGARPRAAETLRNAQDVVEKCGTALAAAERAIERRHGAGMAGIVVANPRPQ